MASPHRLERVQLIPAPRPEVFQFFSRAENLQRITPTFLDFRIETPLPISMRQGALIEYRLALGPMPMRWLTEITLWEPEVRFVDTQLKGPYERWVHLHEFRSTSGGTEMRDVVDYALPLGPLGAAAHSLFVRRTLARIFDFRAEAIEREFVGRSRAA